MFFISQSQVESLVSASDLNELAMLRTSVNVVIHFSSKFELSFRDIILVSLIAEATFQIFLKISFVCLELLS